MITLDRYSEALLRYRWPVVVLATLIMLAMTAGAPLIKVSNDFRILFSEDNPQLLAFDALEATYSESNTLLTRGGPARPALMFTREEAGGRGRP